MAAIMGIGAVLGARKGSTPSAIAGTVLGGAFLFSGYSLSKGDYDLGHGVAAGILSLLVSSLSLTIKRHFKKLPHFSKSLPSLQHFPL